MRDKGWIVPRNDDTEAAIQRGVDVTDSNTSTAPLAPYKDDATRRKLMEILDRRVVMVSSATTPTSPPRSPRRSAPCWPRRSPGRPEVAGLRGELEAFLEDQKEGYARLYDAKAGLFYFGWDATRDRLFGWVDLQGNWTTGHMDYFVNEFRARRSSSPPATGSPPTRSATSASRSSPTGCGTGATVFALAPWDGSAFQAMGLNLMLRGAGRSRAGASC